jgi:seryl-tRNA synthetase
MHDIRWIRDNTGAFIKGLDCRGGGEGGAVASALLRADEELRLLLTDLQQKQARRNEASKLIGQAKAKKDEARAAALMAEVAGLKDAIQQGEAKQRELEAELKNQLAVIPNIPADDVPIGADETANVPVAAREYKAARQPAGGMNAPKEHFTLGEALGMMDFERAAKVSGARFVYLKKDLARLNRALASFMLDSHTTKFGYEEVVPPFLARDDAFFGTGQLPKFEFDQFWAISGEELPTDKFIDDLASEMANEKVQMAATARFRAIKERRFGLVPTAEVPLTNYVNGEILAESELPRPSSPTLSTSA